MSPIYLILLSTLRLWGFFAGVIILRDVFCFFKAKVKNISPEIEHFYTNRSSLTIFLHISSNLLFGIFLVLAGLVLTYNIFIQLDLFYPLMTFAWACLAGAGWLKVFKYSANLRIMYFVSAASFLSTLALATLLHIL